MEILGYRNIYPPENTRTHATNFHKFQQNFENTGIDLSNRKDRRIRPGAAIR